MNQTPRALNRVLLGLLGALLMAVGAITALLAVPAVEQLWRDFAAGAGASVDSLLERTTLAGQRDSWLWIAVAALMLLLVILMIAWVAAQGRGRSGTFAQDDDASTVPGRVTINGSVAEQVLKAALLERRDLVNAVVTTYEFDGRPALKIRVSPRPGVAPYLVAGEISELVEALDVLVGRQTPVLIRLSAGARTRFTRAERVR